MTQTTRMLCLVVFQPSTVCTSSVGRHPAAAVGMGWGGSSRARPARLLVSTVDGHSDAIL